MSDFISLYLLLCRTFLTFLRRVFIGKCKITLYRYLGVNLANDERKFRLGDCGNGKYRYFPQLRVPVAWFCNLHEVSYLIYDGYKPIIINLFMFDIEVWYMLTRIEEGGLSRIVATLIKIRYDLCLYIHLSKLSCQS